MLAGFQLNLAAMSLVSLLVGMFLIYNTIEASVVRRRSEIGILRSLGATRARSARAFSRRSCRARVWSACGRFGRRIFARARSRRHGGGNDLVALRPRPRAANSRSRRGFGSARLSSGLLSVLLAAWLPAQSAAATDPVQALHGGQRLEQSVRLVAWLDSWRGDFAFLAVGLLVAGAARRSAWLGFGAAFFVLAGFSLARAGAELALRRAPGNRRADRAASRRAESRAFAPAQFDHDRFARRRGRDDRRRRSDGLFVPPNGRELDRANARGRSFHRASRERNRRPAFLHAARGDSVSREKSGGRRRSTRFVRSTCPIANSRSPSRWCAGATGEISASSRQRR